MTTQQEEKIEKGLWMFAAETLEGKVLLQEAVPGWKKYFLELCKTTETEEPLPKELYDEQDILKAMRLQIENTIHPGMTGEQKFAVIQTYLEEICETVYAHYNIFQSQQKKEETDDTQLL